MQFPFEGKRRPFCFFCTFWELFLNYFLYVILLFFLLLCSLTLLCTSILYLSVSSSASNPSPSHPSTINPRILISLLPLTFFSFSFPLLCHNLLSPLVSGSCLSWSLPFLPRSCLHLYCLWYSHLVNTLKLLRSESLTSCSEMWQAYSWLHRLKYKTANLLLLWNPQ